MAARARAGAGSGRNGDGDERVAASDWLSLGRGGGAGEAVADCTATGARLVAGPQRGRHYAVGWLGMGRAEPGRAGEAIGEHVATVFEASSVARCWCASRETTKKKGRCGEESGEGEKEKG